MTWNPNIKWEILVLIPSSRGHEAKALATVQSPRREENWNHIASVLNLHQALSFNSNKNLAIEA